jgi:hypothetical protein
MTQKGKRIVWGVLDSGDTRKLPVVGYYEHL